MAAEIKALINALGFILEEGSISTWVKRFPNHNGYTVKVDIDNQNIDYGKKIKCVGRTTCNFSSKENFVVLECVNRLLEKGYKPDNIILENVWPTGHGTSGRLDILVTRDDGSSYMMIECKTFGAEFSKELKKIHKNGGQLFTYFQQDRGAEILMLYCSHLDNKKQIQYQNEIIKIEDDYRQTTSVKDLYDRWNKIPKNNGVFEDWVNPYHFESKALTAKSLKEIRQEDSGFIFNRFLEILRHNVVSDKPNAFNKIFTLFLCKVYDEKTTKENEELKFQWLEGKDNEVSFQIRLADLYKNGMLEFLEKEVSDFSESEFDQRFASLFTGNDNLKQQLKEEIIKLRLEKNNEFAIKEVFDHQSFLENSKIVKEVVELLQGYRIRYNKRQQYLSDFFELLLTTGLKQESGQFFTPVPIAQFIIKSLPLDDLIDEKLSKGVKNELLPYIIDYAAGSGHFLTESMHEIQRFIDAKRTKDYIPDTAKKITTWQNENFDWATQYVYGIEKDYRLVKVGKVGCYLHGDGLANVILSDGLANFENTKEYKGLLKKKDTQFPQENKQFDIVISNPPYSVASFKNASREYYNENDFELYERLTDNSSEIECLFIERTKQLLKDGGIAGIILPSSILNNSGIYTKAREIILQHFEIIGITELGSNTFMATGTNTVTLFLRRRSNYDSINLRIAVDKFFIDHRDVSLNGIEKPIDKYVKHVWDGCSFTDYKSFLSKQPNEAIASNELYKEYRKKIKSKNEEDFWKTAIEKEKEKIFYFILAYPQRVVIVKSGQKDDEKRFLGYEFSSRRGQEGIHAIQRSKSIDECTKMYDSERFDNPEKASTYIYKAFKGDYTINIHSSLQEYIARYNLVDLINFDRTDFEKTIASSFKKKIKLETKWGLKRFDEVADIIRGVTYSKQDQSPAETGKIILTADNITLDGKFEIKKKVFVNDNFEIADEKKLKKGDVFICFSSGSKEHLGKVAYIKDDLEYYAGGFMGIIRSKNGNISKYFYQLLNTLLRQTIRDLGSGSNINNLSGIINDIQIPFPPLEIQEKIVLEIENLEKEEQKKENQIVELNGKIKSVYSFAKNKYTEVTLSNEIQIVGGGTPSTDKPEYWNGVIPWLSIVDFKGVNRFVETTEKAITKEGLNNSSTKYLDAGDIIISARGTVGAVAQLKIPMTFNQSCYGIKALSNLLADYLFFALKFEIEQFKNNSYGAIFDTITTKTFDLIKIPLPTIAEQKKIVAEIEKIDAKIQILNSQLQDIVIQKKETLKKYL